MAYTKTTLTKYGTKAEFMEVLKNFFVNNEVAPFELISEDLTAPTFTVERNNLNLKFMSGTSSDIAFEMSIKNKDGEYVYNSSHRFSGASGSSSITNYAQSVLLAVNGDTLVFQIVGYSDTSAYKGLTVIDTVLENGTSVIGTGSYSGGKTLITFCEPNTSQPYSPRPFHTGSYDETKLIVCNKLAFNDSNGVYYSSATDIISAGGAKQFEYYTTDTNNYYGLLTDVCIPMGDKIEYVVSDTTE